MLCTCWDPNIFTSIKYIKYIDKIHKIKQVSDLPDFMYFIDVNILGSHFIDVFYVFNRCKLIGIPTYTQHLLTQSVRRPEDDRLKGRNM